MKTNWNKKNLTLLGAGACAILLVSVAAFAVPVNQVFRFTGSPFSETGACCSNWSGLLVTITEPKAVAPIIVGFNMDYRATGEGEIGLSLNNGTCLFYGSARLPEFSTGSGSDEPFGNINYQWVINPSDGLKTGKNTIGVCGGGSFGQSQTIVVGFNTLTVQISK